MDFDFGVKTAKRATSYLSGVLVKLLSMLSHLSGQVFGDVNVAALEKGRLSQHFFPIFPMDKVDQDWSASSNLRTTDHPGYLGHRNVSVDIQVVLDDFQDLLLQLRLDFGQKV